MDEGNEHKSGKVTEGSTITLNPGDAALVFREGAGAAELCLSDRGDTTTAPASTILCVAVGIEVNNNPTWVQKVIDKNVMFSGVVVSPETH